MRYFSLLKRLATKSNHQQHKHSSILIKKKHILNFGFNSTKTHPKSTHNFHSTHAELSVLIGSDPADVLDSTLIVARFRSDGTLGLSRPCSSCWSMLQSYGVKEVIYSTNEKEWKRELL